MVAYCVFALLPDHGAGDNNARLYNRKYSLMPSGNEIFDADENARRVTTLVLEEKAVAFVGSGLSAGVYPSWPDLIKKLCVRCDVMPEYSIDANTTPGLLQDLAGQAEASSPKEYEEVLLEVFAAPMDVKRDEDPQRFREVEKAYDTLMAAPFKSLVTVNFDPLLAEHRHRPGNDDYELVKFPLLEALKLEGKSICYVHGYIAPASTGTGELVLTKTSFYNAYDKHKSMLPTFFEVMLRECQIVFIGCGLRDHEIGVCLEEHKRFITDSTFDLAFGSHFMLLPARSKDGNRLEEVETRECAEFERLGITIVRYDKRNRCHTGLVEVLNSWCPTATLNVCKNPSEDYEP